MEELIRKISESIGVDESVATAAVGHVLEIGRAHV